MTDCNHVPGEGCTLVVMADGCSLECTACKEVVLSMELCTLLVDGDDVIWIE